MEKARMDRRFRKFSVFSLSCPFATFASFARGYSPVKPERKSAIVTA